MGCNRIIQKKIYLIMGLKEKMLIVLFGLTCTLLLVTVQKRRTCRYLVVLENNTKIKATTVNMYKSGFADIRKCNGEAVTLRDYSIDTVYVVNK